MGQTSLTENKLRRRLRSRYLQWRIARNRDTAIHYLDHLALALEQHGRHCVKTYNPLLIPVRIPLLRVYGPNGIVLTLTVMAVPGGGWAFHEAPPRRGSFLCHCENNTNRAAQLIDRFLQDRPQE
ncbi:hypothetical protein GCM10022254_22580 [Actinomadura meridiana]|uniref:Uncharacterized protein n=1 Tax=Actinomadura meridiana TaxID=559626 RepID=A0ABP8BXF7_9ACTN